MIHRWSLDLKQSNQKEAQDFYSEEENFLSLSLNMTEEMFDPAAVSRHFSTTKGAKLRRKPILWNAEVKYIKIMSLW